MQDHPTLTLLICATIVCIGLLFMILRAIKKNRIQKRVKNGYERMRLGEDEYKDVTKHIDKD